MDHLEALLPVRKLVDEFADDAENVVAGFRDGGDAAVFIDTGGTGVIGREGEFDTSFIFIEELFEVAGAAVDVLGGIEGVGYAELLCGGGHELHEALGSFGGDSARFESAFAFNNGADEIFAQALAGGRVFDEGLDLVEGDGVAGGGRRRGDGRRFGERGRG